MLILLPMYSIVKILLKTCPCMVMQIKFTALCILCVLCVCVCEAAVP